MVALRKPQERVYTSDEYLELERKSNYKSEFLAGQIYAMSGGSPKHSRIGANLIKKIGNQLEEGPCHVYTSDLKVRTTAQGLFAYPDVTVVCGNLIFHDEEEDIIVNPTLLVEVLSRTTEAYDRGRKWAQYQSIASLQTYVLVAQDMARIEQYTRQPDDTWLLSTVAGMDRSIYLASIDCTLALSEVYAGVDFNPPPSVYPA